MPPESDLPPEFDDLLAAADRQPESARQLWRYAIALMLVDDEKAHFVGSHRDGDTLHLVVQPVAGEIFSIVRPPMTEEVEHALLSMIRHILDVISKQ